MRESPQQEKDKKSIMRKLLKKILSSDYTLSVAVKLFTAAIGIVSSAYCTRFLGVQYKGDYSYITQMVNIAVLILNMGIYQSYSYNYKKYGPSITQKYINICFLQFVILICIAGVLIVATRDMLFSMVVILVPFNILRMQYSNIVLIEKIRLNFMMNAFNTVLLTICYAMLYYFATPSIVYIIGATVLIDIITVGSYAIGLRVVPKAWDIDFGFLNSILRFGFIPMLSGLLSTINYRVDILFLKHIGLPEELSYYSLAAGLIGYVWMLPDAFKSVLFSKSGKKFDRENILFSSQISSMFILLCFVGFAILGKFLLRLVYGEEFIYSYGVTLLLIIGAFSMSLYKITGVVLVSQGRRIAHFVTLVISAVVNVLLNILLIPRMGMYGAAIASVFSYTICGLILLLYFCKLYNMNVKNFVIPTKDTIDKLKAILKLRRNNAI